MQLHFALPSVGVFLALACLPLASALTVVPSALFLDSGGVPDSHTGQYALRIYQDAGQSDETSIFFDYHAGTQELVFRTALIDESSDWYFVTTGETFSLSGIEDGAYEEFNGANQPFPLPYGDFFLGGATGQGFGPDSEANRTVLAWAHFSASASGLTLLDSAVAYDAGAIVVGTLSATPIPEPAAGALLVALASLGIAARRRPARSRA